MSISHLTSTSAFDTGTGARTVTPNASSAAGDLLIVPVGFQDSSATTITTPTGFTVQKSAVTTGTLKTSIFSRVKQSGDTTWTYTPSQSVETSHLALTIVGADASSLIVGSDGTRAASGGTTATTAPSITTTLPNSRVYIIATERTTANETVEATVNNGFTKISHTYANGTSAESLFVGYKDMPTAGAVGATTVTYQNSQGTNGYAVLIAVAEAGAYTGTFTTTGAAATSVTGSLGLHGTFATTVAASDVFGPRIKVRVFASAVASPPENPRVRLYKSSVSGTALVIPKVRVYSSALAGSPLVLLTPIPDRIENPERLVSLHAALQGGGFADNYTWRRISGVAVTLDVNNDDASFTVPSIVAPGAVQIGCKATVNGVDSPEIVTTITIIPQTVFSRMVTRPWVGALRP